MAFTGHHGKAHLDLVVCLEYALLLAGYSSFIKVTSPVCDIAGIVRLSHITIGNAKWFPNTVKPRCYLL